MSLAALPTLWLLPKAEPNAVDIDVWYPIVHETYVPPSLDFPAHLFGYYFDGPDGHPRGRVVSVTNKLVGEIGFEEAKKKARDVLRYDEMHQVAKLMGIV